MLILLITFLSINSAFAHPNNPSQHPGIASQAAVVSDQDVIIWANKHLIEAFTFYFEDIDEWRKNIKSYFTKEGYAAFIDSLEQSKTLALVLQNRLIVQPQLEGNALIVSKGLRRQLYEQTHKWYVLIPIQITYLGPQDKKSEELFAALEIEQQKKADGHEFLIIHSLKLYPNDKTKASLELMLKKMNEEAKIQN